MMKIAVYSTVSTHLPRFHVITSFLFRNRVNLKFIFSSDFIWMQELQVLLHF